MADAGIRLVVEGEKEFKSALAACDTAIKNNQKELKLLTEEFKLNETGMKDASSGFGSMADAAEILAQKGKVLADSIAAQTEKVGLLDQRVKEASEAYGEHDRRTEALRLQLLDASTALAKLTNEQEKNRQAIEDAKNSTAEYDAAEQKLTAALAANEAELKTMGGGMDALKKEYEQLGSSSDDLAKKQENLRAQNESLEKQNKTLSDSIEKQKKQIDTLNDAAKLTTQRYGEGSKEAEAYRKKVADATGQLDKMERELKENKTAIEQNNAALEQSGESPKKLIDELNKVEELTGIKIPAGIKDMVGGMDEGAIAAGGIVTVLTTVAAKMADIYADSLKWARDITTKSQELDLNTGEYQALEYAATKAGFEMTVFEKALLKISERAMKSDEILGDYVGNMGDLKYASDDVKKAVADEMKYWDDLGVQLYDTNGEVKSAHDLMYELIDALGSMESETQKNAAAQEVFGKKFSVIKPAIDTGTEALKSFEDEAYRTGVVLSEDQVEDLNKAGAAWDTFAVRVDSAKKRLASKVSWQDLIPGWNQIRSLGHLKDFFGTLFGVSGSYANGTMSAPGGYSLVGERGPEIVELPRGSKVFPNGMVPAGFGGGETVYETNTYNVTIDASRVQEFEDIVRIAQSARVGMRRG